MEQLLTISKFDSLPGTTFGIGSVLSSSAIQGNGSIYTNADVLNIQSLGDLSLSPPSPTNVLGTYRPLSGIMVMTPSYGTLQLIDLRYACGVVSGGRTNPPPPQGCTITVNCTSTFRTPVVQNLTFPAGGPAGSEFSYAQFDDTFDYLTSCSFLVDIDEPATAETLSMLFDNVGYAIYNYTLAPKPKRASSSAQSSTPTPSKAVFRA